MEPSEDHERAQSIIDEITTRSTYVFIPRKGKMALYVLVFFILVILFAFLLIKVERGTFEWVGLLLFVGLSILSLVTMARSPSLTVNREGLTFRGSLRGYSYKWKDIERFQVMKVSAGWGSMEMVAILLSKATQTEKLSDKLKGRRESLPDSYAISVREMADLLNRVRDHFLRTSEW